MAEHKYAKGWQAYQQAMAIDPEIFTDARGPKVQNPSHPCSERGAMNYYMALGCARAGYTDCALQYLRMALDEGFTSPRRSQPTANSPACAAIPHFSSCLPSSSSQ